jgi:hypothetical protein
MSSRRDDARGDVFHPDSAMDEVFARANPNPERKGCPTDEMLRALANRERPITDPGYEHLAQCSPCYRSFRRIQEEGRVATSTHSSRGWRWVAAAAVLLLAVASVWLMWMRGGIPDGGTPEIRAQMDLRQYAVDRGEASLSMQRPLVAARARLDLTILLPVGSEAGSYELQVMDSELRSQSASHGEAKIENYLTRLHTRIDLRNLSPGEYRLAIRRKGEDWSFFPLRIK